MDKQLIFCYFNKIVITKGKTKMEYSRVEMIRLLNSEEVKGGKSTFMIIQAMNESWRKLTIRTVSTS